MSKTKLTSVKLLKSLYLDFKKTTINTSMTLQKLTNRSIDLYLSELHDTLMISGSNF